MRIDKAKDAGNTWRIVKAFNAVYTAYRLSESGSTEYEAAMVNVIAKILNVEMERLYEGFDLWLRRQKRKSGV